MTDSHSSDEIEIVSVCKRARSNANSTPVIIDLTGSGNTLSILIVDPIDKDEDVYQVEKEDEDYSKF